MISCNRKLAVEPFPVNHIETKTKNNFASLKQKTTLTPLYVVYGNNTSYKTGDTVYVKADLMVQPAATETYELDGKTFILIPEEWVMLVEFGTNA